MPNQDRTESLPTGYEGFSAEKREKILEYKRRRTLRERANDPGESNLGNLHFMLNSMLELFANGVQFEDGTPLFKDAVDLVRESEQLLKQDKPKTLPEQIMQFRATIIAACMLVGLGLHFQSKELLQFAGAITATIFLFEFGAVISKEVRDRRKKSIAERSREIDSILKRISTTNDFSAPSNDRE